MMHQQRVSCSGVARYWWVASTSIACVHAEGRRFEHTQ